MMKLRSFNKKFSFLTEKNADNSKNAETYGLISTFYNIKCDF